MHILYIYYIYIYIIYIIHYIHIIYINIYNIYYDLVRAPVDAFINKISHNNLLLF